MFPVPAAPTDRLILGIETSCDETAAAVVRASSHPCPALGASVLSSIIASQDDLHAEYRGVVPEIASRAHAERILPIVRAALDRAGIDLTQLSAIAVSNRPGLIGSLLVGVAAAKALAWSLDVPIIGVDHVRAHLCAGCLLLPSAPDAQPTSNTFTPPSFPAIGLVVSGGHTSLYRCESLTTMTRLGGTIDDAVGEAYDKVAAILGLPFPGGPRVDQVAQSVCVSLPRATDGSSTSVSPPRATGGSPASACTGVPLPEFPIARIAPNSLDFSFSGLKTAALYAFRGVPEDDRARAKREAKGLPPHPTYPAPIVAAAFQHAAIAAVILKIERALDLHPDCRTILVGGGVSANSLLRSRLLALAKTRTVDARLPPMELCLDNGAMIAGLALAVLEERAWTSDQLTMTAVPTTGS